ncbi:MAG: patatin-like phospholipase family protein, partial [Clostridia bacterium]|nr:patatin-like phospholipase family protein [Deltaproteobacteria bacterium]
MNTSLKTAKASKALPSVAEPLAKTDSRPVRALVLSGGGARGAYEAGVLAYIFQELPTRLLANAPVKILCGTSVGAITACFLAGSAHLPHMNTARLLDLWRRLRLDKTLRLRVVDVLRMPFELRATFRQEASGVVLNSAVLQEIVVRETPWIQIRHNIRAGILSAVTVSATHVASGRTVTFVDRTEGGTPPWSRDTRAAARAARIRPVHAMASAAIPYLFAPIAIDGAWYCDGSVRQNTPLSPALRLGADRVLTLGLRYDGQDADWPPKVEEPAPQPLALMGKLLNSLMLDNLDYDLKTLQGFNEILRSGQAALGDVFLDHLRETSNRFRVASYRQVESVFIRP